MRCPLSAALLLAASLAVADAHAPAPLVVYLDDTPGGPAVAREIGAAVERKLGGAVRAPRIEVLAVDLSDKALTRDALARELSRNPAAIIAGNSNATMVAQSLTRDIPVIFGSREDPVALGFVRSLAHPGGNLTGMTYFVPVDAKRLELLHELAPRARRLGILIDRWWLDDGGGRAVARAAHDRFAYDVELFRAETAAELARELAGARAKSVDAWYVPLTWLPYAQPEAVVAAFAATRRPAIYAAARFVEAGGLASYGEVISRSDIVELIASPLALVLQGVPAGDIPVERPKAFELAVNVAAARELGIVIPDGVYKRANRVVAR